MKQPSPNSDVSRSEKPARHNNPITSRLDPAHAFAFGGGVGLYLLGTIIFRRASGIPGVAYKYIAASLAALTGLVGSVSSAGLQFIGLILIVVVLVLVESRRMLVKQPG